MSKKLILIATCALAVAVAATFFLYQAQPEMVGLGGSIASRTSGAERTPDGPSRPQTSASVAEPATPTDAPNSPLLDRTSFSVEEWILSLPVENQARARSFVESYGTAYLVRNNAEREWILLHGYPSLEDVVAFSPDMMSRCPVRGCKDSTVSALSADFILNGLEKTLAEQYSDGELPEDYLGNLPEDSKAEFVRSLSALQAYIGQARDNGSLMFAAHLRSRLGRLTGNDVESTGAEALLVACGDPRVTLADPVAQRTAIGIVGSMPGSTAICGYSPSRPAFPD